MRRSRKPLCVVKAYRGFESLPLRLRAFCFPFWIPGPEPEPRRETAHLMKRGLRSSRPDRGPRRFGCGTACIRPGVIPGGSLSRRDYGATTIITTTTSSGSSGNSAPRRRLWCSACRGGGGYRQIDVQAVGLIKPETAVAVEKAGDLALGAVLSRLGRHSRAAGRASRASRGCQAIRSSARRLARSCWQAGREGLRRSLPRGSRAVDSALEWRNS